MVNKNNNFDFLRLIFATCVIISHSFTLSGFSDCDYLCQFSNAQINFSYIGVKGFFVISGYLIFQSLKRSENIFDYFWKRILRLFPALFLVLLLTIILTPFVYKGDVPFLLNKSVLTYIPNNFSLYRMQYKIDGVFEDNPYDSSINGSLWTIRYEFTFYILLSFFIFFRNYKIMTNLILLILFLLLFICNIFFFNKLKEYGFILRLEHLLDLGIFFIAGSILASLNIEKFTRKKELLIFICLLLSISIYLNFYNYTKYLTFPILLILFGLNPIPLICNVVEKFGDLSYGIYIYAFPVQQTLVYYFKLNYFDLMIYSLIITFLLAFFSWHIIEKNSLKYKKIILPTKKL
jgi:peptidoglycan/LPS O-acetylase OafA/YrhL